MDAPQRAGPGGAAYRQTRPDAFSVVLASGHAMPMVGFGTSRLRGAQCRAAVLNALRAGYRHVDTAKLYGNEAAVGEAIRQALAEGVLQDRAEVFVTTKLWNDDHRPEHVARACRESLARLGLEYVDLYLIHWPTSWRRGTLFCPDWTCDLLSTWTAMERLVAEGLVRSIGVSNFGPRRLRRILNEGTLRPAVNQVEAHPLFQNAALLKFCSDSKIVVAAWSPLAKCHRDVMAAPALKLFARRHEVSVPQVVLRWNLQRGVAVLPRTTSMAHAKSNRDVFGFRLTPASMALVGDLDRGWRGRLAYDVVGVFEETPLLPWGMLGSVGKVCAFVLWQFIPSVLEPCNPQESVVELFRGFAELSVADGVRAALGLALLAWAVSRLLS